MYKWFRLYVARDGEHFTLIRFRPEIGTVKVDRTHSGFPHDIVNIREFPVSLNGGVLKLRVIMDRYSLEVFVNDGEQAASFVLYTPPTASAVSFSSDGSVLVDVEKYDLEMN
jgi:beta-fructofuranosidase